MRCNFQLCFCYVSIHFTGKLQANYQQITNIIFKIHYAPGKVTNNLGYKSVGKLGN